MGLCCLSLAALLVIIPINAQTGTYFVPVNTVCASYSRWVLSFTFSLIEIERELKEVESHVENFRVTTANYFEDGLQRIETYGNDTSLSALIQSYVTHYNAEFLQFEQELITLLNTYKLITQTSGRTPIREKRALVPIIGDALSWLFSTASESEIQGVQDGLVKLQSAQKMLVHVVDKSLTMVNKTMSVAKENREAVNSLINSQKTLDLNLLQVKRILQVNIHPQIKYTQISTKMHHIYHLVSHSLEALKTKLNLALNEIEHSLQGKLSPSLVPPAVLKSILKQIKRALPNNLALPWKISRQLNMYYSELSAVVVPAGDHILVLTSLPLTRNDDYFNRFEVVSVPVPNPQLRLAAQYTVEAPYLAISADRTKYVLLEASEAQKCMDKPISYFAFNHAEVSFARTPSCVTALFNSDATTIKALCKQVIMKMAQHPMVKHLYDGNWLIASGASWDLMTKCPKTPLTSITYEGPIDVVNLPPTCEGKMVQFTLPPFYRTESKFDIENFFTMHSMQVSSLQSIWNDTTLGTIDELKIAFAAGKVPQMLDQIHSLPIGELKDILQVSLANTAAASSKTTPTNWALGAFQSFCFILMIVFFGITWAKLKRVYNAYDLMYRRLDIMTRFKKTVVHPNMRDYNMTDNPTNHSEETLDTPLMTDSPAYAVSRREVTRREASTVAVADIQPTAPTATSGSVTLLSCMGYEQVNNL